jgi:hypothetical protein
MDVDLEPPRGVKRKADDLFVVTAPRRIQVSFNFQGFLQNVYF